MKCTAEQNQLFVAMLPKVREQARFAFRREPSGRRQDLVSEVVANAFVAFARLVERGLVNAIYPTPLAQFAIKQVRDGRRVGSRLNVRDVSSQYAQQAKGLCVERLDRYDVQEGEWREVLVEDKHAGPAETAASRIDFDAWLRLLPKRTRRIAETLATGETTTKAAKRFRVSPGRISQLRRELQQNWRDFQGDVAQG